MEAIAETIVSAIIEKLVSAMASPDLLNFARREQVHTHLKIWTKILPQIQAVLQDAEEKQLMNGLVKNWLDELRDLAYDVDDLLDGFATEVLLRRLSGEHQASTSKACNLLFYCLSDISPASIKVNVKMGYKIKEINSRLQDIIKRKEDLDLRENAGVMHKKALKRMPSTSLVNESSVFGRERDKDAILKLLLQDPELCDDRVRVIPIIGMGGVGKTTLAQLVYNDKRVRSFFESKAWVCVSEEFDVIRVMRTVLQSVSLEACDLNDLNLLQMKVKEILSRERFLVVLDDVWNENYEKLTALLSPFEVGSSGCSIIVTTRNGNVACMMGTLPAYLLKEMSFDNCLSLFTHHALGKENFDDHPKLEVFGQEIVKKCKGLPLAAKALGGLLRRKLDWREWESVLNSKIWDLGEEETGILPALRLSYQNLPSHLKQCFAYCALFPKDYEFDKDELIQLWIAEGFIGQQKGTRQMEDTGSMYFSELLSRSFFQQSSVNHSRYMMHDLINDLAQSVAGEVCFRLEDKMESNGQRKVFERARHSSYVRQKYDVVKKFEVFYEMRGLRTFLALPVLMSDLDLDCYLSNVVLKELVPKLSCLRVLSLSGYCITEVPDSIGDLKHLRYLNLSRTKIICLPESISALCNLQALNLSGCKKLKQLPQGTGNLINLLYLDIVDTDDMKELPLKIGNLINLKRLPKFIVGKDNGPKIKELKALSHLRGSLFIFDLQNVIDVGDAFLAHLREKRGLDEIVLKWGDASNDLQSRENEMPVLEMLKPHSNLKILRILDYGGAKFPSWIGDPSFTIMADLSLSDCRAVTVLPSLGRLPYLKDLNIEGMSRVEHIGSEFYGATSESNNLFPSLESLRLGNMPEWKEWSSHVGFGKEEGLFPRLCELRICNCPKLIGSLPSELPCLQKLYISECPQLVVSHLCYTSLCELNLDKCNKSILSGDLYLTSLTNLRIEGIGLTCLHEGLTRCLVSLEVLEVEECDKLMCLWKKEAKLENLSFLKRLVIMKCPQLVCLTDEEQELPGNLEHLELEDCSELEKLPNGLHRLTSLKDLRIKWCPNLLTIPKTGLPPMLRNLTILEIMTLASLLVMLMHNNSSSVYGRHLESLEIADCPSLVSFPEGELPCSLKKLEIWDCTLLESLSERLVQNNMSLEFIRIGNCTNLKVLPECLYNFKRLTELHIIGCPSLKHFPESGLPIPFLRSIYIDNCMELKSLPSWMQYLTSLQYLAIFRCPQVMSFPEGGFPPNLLSLYICICKNLSLPMSMWGLHKLTSLKDLNVGDCNLDITLFPEDSMLPTSLIHLRIQMMKNLKFLSEGLQNLISLEKLDIWDCPMLQSFPNYGFPVMLGALDIRKCPLLKQKYFKRKGMACSMILRIPCVRIDYDEIH